METLLKILKFCQRFLPWAVALPLIPKLLLSLIIISCTAFLLALLWIPQKDLRGTSQKPIQNFASSYTLAADLNINTPNVHINGINVRGNVNLGDTQNVTLKDNKVFKSQDNSKGKINIADSQEFNLEDNVVAKEINVSRSKAFDIMRNKVGENEDRDALAQESINVILTKTSNDDQVTSNLQNLQKLLYSDDNLASALGGRIKKFNEDSNGYYKDLVLSHFKKLGAESQKKAIEKGFGLVFYWFNSFLNIER